MQEEKIRKGEESVVREESFAEKAEENVELHSVSADQHKQTCEQTLPIGGASVDQDNEHFEYTEQHKPAHGAQVTKDAKFDMKPFALGASAGTSVTLPLQENTVEHEPVDAQSNEGNDSRNVSEELPAWQTDEVGDTNERLVAILDWNYQTHLYSSKENPKTILKR
jgi:hypothetical protein